MFLLGFAFAFGPLGKDGAFDRAISRVPDLLPNRGLGDIRLREYRGALSAISEESKQTLDWFDGIANETADSTVIHRTTVAAYATDEAVARARLAEMEAVAADLLEMLADGDRAAELRSSLRAAAIRSVLASLRLPVLPDGATLDMTATVVEVLGGAPDPAIRAIVDEYRSKVTPLFDALLDRAIPFRRRLHEARHACRQAIRAGEPAEKLLNEIADVQSNAYSLGWQIRDANIDLLMRLRGQVDPETFALLFDAVDHDLFATLLQGADVSPALLELAERGTDQRPLLLQRYHVCMRTKIKILLETNEDYSEMVSPKEFRSWALAWAYVHMTGSNPTGVDRDIMSEKSELGEAWLAESKRFERESRP